MFEIKVTGNTPEEIQQNMLKMAKFFDAAIEAGDAVITKKEETPKATKQDKPSKEVKETEKEKPVVEDKSEEESTPQQDAKTVTLEEVRAKGTELARANKRDFVKQVLTAAGAAKLSDVATDKLAYVMECFNTGKVLDEDDLPF